MTDAPKHIDVVHRGPVVVEVDATKIAQIVFDTCRTSEARATRAANLIIDYLAQAHQNASRPQ
jgi:hypothetical protein